MALKIERPMIEQETILSMLTEMVEELVLVDHKNATAAGAEDGNTLAQETFRVRDLHQSGYELFEKSI